MGNVTLYLPDDLHEYARTQDLKLSGILQDAIRAHLDEHSELEAKFRTELEKYRTSPDRKLDWERINGPGEPFSPCETCGTGVDEAEGCLTIFEPYDAAPVALMAHFPPELRRGMLEYWRDSGYTDAPMGPV